MENQAGKNSEGSLSIKEVTLPNGEKVVVSIGPGCKTPLQKVEGGEDLKEVIEALMKMLDFSFDDLMSRNTIRIQALESLSSIGEPAKIATKKIIEVMHRKEAGSYFVQKTAAKVLGILYKEKKPTE